MIPVIKPHLVGDAQWIVLTLPITAATRGLVSRDILSRCRGAVLLNAGRGAVVQEAALPEALDQGWLRGAALDVFETEPPDANDPILKLDNIIAAPHALCWTDQCFAGNGAADVKAVLDVQKGLVPRGVVNTSVLQQPNFKAKLAAFAARFG